MKTASFTISEVSKLRQDAGNAWLEFLDVPSLSMGIYQIPAGTDDRDIHNPHDRDEIYVGTSGSGRLTADGEEFHIEAGVIVYVKAGVEHHFHDIADDLTVLVFFSGKSEMKGGSQ
jgi:mannose-6-phosphate isomerase-like protein (cupin superfamily)